MFWDTCVNEQCKPRLKSYLIVWSALSMFIIPILGHETRLLQQSSPPHPTHPAPISAQYKRGGFHHHQHHWTLALWILAVTVTERMQQYGHEVLFCVCMNVHVCIRMRVCTSVCVCLYNQPKVYIHQTFLKVLSTWLSLTNEIKPLVRRTNQLFMIRNP